MFDHHIDTHAKFKAIMQASQGSQLFNNIQSIITMMQASQGSQLFNYIQFITSYML
jgi:hypothetical protein